MDQASKRAQRAELHKVIDLLMKMTGSNQRRLAPAFGVSSPQGVQQRLSSLARGGGGVDAFELAALADLFEVPEYVLRMSYADAFAWWFHNRVVTDAQNQGSDTTSDQHKHGSWWTDATMPIDLRDGVREPRSLDLVESCLDTRKLVGVGADR